MKYRKRPIEIEAIQFTRSSFLTLEKFTDNKIKILMEKHPNGRVWAEIETLEGTMTAELNDYIIKGIEGEFYSCKPDIFEKSYEMIGPISAMDVYVDGELFATGV